MASGGALRAHQRLGPPKHAQRELLNALFYQARAGCAWRLLPHDFPPYRTVYKQFEAWREDGTWDRLLAGWRGHGRQAAGRHPEPTAGAIDTQAVRTGGKRGLSRLRRRQASIWA